jgi:hypothetical protein
MRIPVAVAMCRMLLVATAIVGLAGCERTVFQSAPAAAQDCDPDLVGRWLSQGDKDDKDGELEAIVDKRCQLVTIEHKQDGARRSEPTTLHNARIGGVRYLWLDAAWANRSFEVKPNVLDRDGDVYLFAYRVRSGRLRLSNAPPQAIAHRVLDKDIDGSVLMHDNELTVRVEGDAEAIRKLLGKHRVFRFDAPLRFRLAPAKATP